jgi:hypothetical protein
MGKYSQHQTQSALKLFQSQTNIMSFTKTEKGEDKAKQLGMCTSKRMINKDIPFRPNLPAIDQI